MRDVSFGQYYPAKSFLHKCDPRVKLVFLILYIVAIFLTKNFYALGACAFAFVVMVAVSRVPLKSVLRSIKGILVLLFFTACLNLFFYSDGKVLLRFWIVKITEEGVYCTVFLAVRLMLLVAGSSLLTLTTTPVALTDGIESLFSFLKIVRFPVHELALVMSIALRFIPILTDETARIINAQKARGANFESGNVVKRVKAVVPVLIPLLISAFRRADELGDAMDARCYSGSKVRTKYKKLKLSWRDLLVALFACALYAGVILFRIYFAHII